jgi:uncharacterized BrkB/YihY/UPF0761 family membrane protein
VPAVALAFGILGLLVGDAASRTAVVSLIGGVRPLALIVEAVLVEASGAAAAFGVLGAGALVWGASRFAVALEESLSLVIDGGQRRSTLRRNVLAVAAVVVLVAGLVTGVLVFGALDILDRAADLPSLPLAELVPLAWLVIAVAGTYRLVPVASSSWRAIVPPAAAVSVVLAILTRGIVLFTPWMVGLAAVLGSLVSVFLALAWLRLAFLALLFGAVWVGVRASRASLATDQAEVAQPS